MKEKDLFTFLRSDSEEMMEGKEKRGSGFESTAYERSVHVQTARKVKTPKQVVICETRAFNVAYGIIVTAKNTPHAVQ